MRRTLVIAGVLIATAAAASAQTSAPGNSGGLFGDGLAGRITGFGDLPTTSGPAANSGAAVSSPVNTLPITGNPFAGNSFRPAGLFLVPANTVPSGGEAVSTLASTGSANGSGVGAAPVSTAAGRGVTIFAGGIGPRRFGVK
jgi:hypothetical protein